MFFPNLNFSIAIFNNIYITETHWTFQDISDNLNESSFQTELDVVKCLTIKYFRFVSPQLSGSFHRNSIFKN